MHFRKFLGKDNIFLDRDFDGLDEVLQFLSSQLAKSAGISETKVLSLLQEREKLSSTWIGNGTMLPHNHSPEVKDIYMIFIRCRNPLVLANGNRVKYIFSILTSGSQNELYLSLLQGIGSLIQKHSDEVDQCKTSEDLLELLSSGSFGMGKTMTAADLARPWPRACEKDTLANALDQMKRHNVYFIPVYSETGNKIVGVLDLVDLLKAGFPDYVFSLHNLSVLDDFQPVHYFWNNENKLIIRDFLRDHRPYMIKGDVSYPEVFFMIIKSNRRHLLVVNEKDELLGIIHPTEIINKMLRP